MRKLPKVLKNKKLRRRSKAEEPQATGVPRITNETVAEHREEVLGSARKYIYPLQHSKHRVVIITIGLIITAVVAFFTYATLALYRFQTTSTFMYRVTQVIPFPIARSGGQFIAYENYLFELRHYMHYYERQQKLDFENEGKEQLEEFKHRALQKVINDAYIKRLAKENNVSVSDQEVDALIQVFRQQDRLGVSNQVLEDVLKDYYGWSLDDFRRTLRQQILAQKVAAALDPENFQRADAALQEVRAGTDFVAVAAKYSDDTASKDNGGEFGYLIERSNPDLPAQTIEALFNMEPGEVSEVINVGYSLEIVKVIERQGERVRAAHILLNFADIETPINDLKEQQPVRLYLSLPPPPSAETVEPTTPEVAP